MTSTGHLALLAIGLVVLAGLLLVMGKTQSPRWRLCAGIVTMGVLVGWLIWALSTLSAFGSVLVGP